MTRNWSLLGGGLGSSLLYMSNALRDLDIEIPLERIGVNVIHETNNDDL